MIYGELGRHPLCIGIKTRVNGYWGSLLKGKETKLNRTTVYVICILLEHITMDYIFSANIRGKWLFIPLVTSELR